MTILDSNVWIALLNKDDSQHSRAQDIIEQRQDKVAITEYVILEVCTVLQTKVNKKTAIAFLDIVSNNNNIDVILSDENFFKNVMGLFQKNKDAKLSFIDVSLLYLSRSIHIITFDKNLKKEIDET